jgi:branched-chain amino acid transport system permease protein
MFVEFVQQIVNGLIIGSTYALMAIGLTLIFGMMDVVNFAHGEFYMLGGFFAYYLTGLLDLNFYLSVLLSVLIVVGTGLLCERLLLKPLRKETIITTVLVTIGLSIFLKNGALIIWGARPKLITSSFALDAIHIGPIAVTEAKIFAFAVTVLSILLAHLGIQKTRLGRAMRATFQDKEAASLVGISVSGIYALTFALGAGLAATAGSLIGTIFLVYPDMGELAAMKAFVVVILGGMGSFVGAIFGGFILGVAEAIGAGFISSGYKDAIGFIIVILILMFKPSGLFKS